MLQVQHLKVYVTQHKTQWPPIALANSKSRTSNQVMAAKLCTVEDRELVVSFCTSMSENLRKHNLTRSAQVTKQH